MMTERVQVREVGPRDGLQLVKTVLGTEQKLEWCRRAAEAGVPMRRRLPAEQRP